MLNHPTQFVRIATMTIAMLTVVGCGVPEDKHNAVLRSLEEIKGANAELQTSLSEAQAERDRLKGNVNALGGEKDALAQRLGATKKELEELRKARMMAEQRTKTFRELVRRLQSMIDSGKLKVNIRKGRMIVQLSDKILFDPGKIKLKDDGKAALQQLATVLKDIGNRDFLVAGHTDNVPIKTRRFGSNWELSAGRAVVVVKFLQEQGVAPKHLSAAGFSEYDPVGDNANPEGRKSNRRIEVVLLPNIEELPRIEM